MRATPSASTRPAWMTLQLRWATTLLAVSAIILFSSTLARAVDREEGLSGEVNAGGSIASGNTDTTRFDAEVRARFKSGRLEDNYRLSFEFADDNGVTTAQRILGTAESRMDIRDGLFVFGFLEYDDDRFSGFKYEVESALGVGYKLIDDSKMRFLVQSGVGYRFSKLSGLGTNQDELVIRGSADFEYDITDSMNLTNVSVVTWDSERTTLENTIAVTNDLIADLSSRISFNVRYNSDPPLLTRKTDTLTKLSLVYDF